MARTDVAIVGGGIAGLACAAFLARQGVGVELHERSERLGGSARSVKVGPWRVPANQGRIELPRPGDPARRLLEHLEIDAATWAVPVSEALDLRHGDGTATRWPAGVEGSAAVLGEAFPAERERVRRAMAGLERLARESEASARDERHPLVRLFSDPFRYPMLFRQRRRALGDFLRGALREPRTRAALAAPAALFASDPAAMSLHAFALAAGGYLARPAAVPGGGHALAQALTEAARRAGAALHTGSPVRTVLVAGRAAAGLRTDRETVAARIVVSTAAPLVTFGALVPREAVHAALLQRIGQMRPSASAALLLLALRIPRADLPAGDLVVAQAGGDLDAQTAAIDEDGAAGRTLVVALHPETSARGAEAHQGTVTPVTVQIPDRVARWAAASADERRALERDLTATVLARLAFLHPDPASVLAASRFLSPLDLSEWSGDPDGARFGHEPIPGQAGSSRLPAHTEVDGLLLAGASTYPGAGYTGTLLSGFLAGLQAAVLLGKRVRL